MCGKIDIITYHEFTIDKNYFEGESVFTKVNGNKMTCSYLFKRQYKQMRKKSFPCVKFCSEDIFQYIEDY